MVDQRRRREHRALVELRAVEFGEIPVEDLAGEPILMAQPFGVQPGEPFPESAQIADVLLRSLLGEAGKLGDREPPLDAGFRV
jgi:hypothetical protein